MEGEVKPTQVKRSDKEHVDAVDGGNLVHGSERLVRLNLHNSQDRPVGLLQVFGERGRRGEALHGNGRAEPPPAQGRELGRLDELSGVVDCAEEGDDDLPSQPLSAHLACHAFAVVRTP